MWHDARRNEKAVYAVINERQKRALKRSQKYQAVRADPAEHLQLHGRSYRVHADAQLAKQAHRHALRPWGPDKVLIDRFDARAHLDSVPSRSSSAGAAGGGDGDMPPDARDKLEAMLCYERYRVLVANEFMKMPEERFLKQIYYEENLGKAYNPKTKPSRAHIKAEADKKKQSASTKTAIGFNYDQAGSELDDAAQLQQGDAQAAGGKEQGHEEDKESDEEIVDDTWDMPLNARQLSSEQSWQLNRLALDYDIPSGQFINLLWQDREDQDKMKELKCIEEARALLVGPAAKRERALLKESKVLLMGSKNVADPAGASTTLLSFLNKDKPQFGSGPSARLPSRRSASDSDDSASRGGANEGAIQYISSFGADEQPEADDDEEGGGGGHPPQGPALPPQQYRRMLALRRRKGSSSPAGKAAIQPSPRRQNSRSRSRSASGRSRSRGTRRRGSRRTPSRSRSRSRSRSPGRRRDRRRAGRHRRSTSPKRGSARERRRRSSSSASPPSIIRDTSPPASPAHLPSGSIGHWLPLSSGRAGGAESPPASHVSLLSERSSLSDDQLEQRQVENRRRRVRAAKFNLTVKQCGQTVARQRDAPQPPSTTTTTTTPSEPSVGAAKLREKMRLKTARAFKRTLAKERDTQLLKYEEVMKERRQRDDELRQLDRQRRARERDTSPAAAPARRKDKRSGDNSPPAQHKDSPPL